MNVPPSPGHDWKQSLAALAGKRVVLVGIGRRDSGDDGVGPLVVELLRARTSLSLLDAQTTPENFIGPIARATPDVVLLVDAAAFSAPPGEVRLFQGPDLDETDFTTHAMSPRLFLDFLAQRTGARTLLLAVQPARTGPAVPMSPPVHDAARSIADFLARLFPSA